MECDLTMTLPDMEIKRFSWMQFAVGVLVPFLLLATSVMVGAFANHERRLQEIQGTRFTRLEGVALRNVAAQHVSREEMRQEYLELRQSIEGLRELVIEFHTRGTQ